MGKRRKVGGFRESEGSSNKKSEVIITPSASIDPTARDYIYDEVDDFEDEEEFISLQTAKELMHREPAPTEEVWGLGESSSDEDGEEEDDDDDDDDDDEEDEEGGSEDDPDQLFMEDDIVDEPEFQMPDERAWGRKKHSYFGTDMGDEKIKRNIYNQDEEMAQLEEETTRKLQERMAAEVKDLVSDDLILQTDGEDKDKDKDSAAKDWLETDISSLSRTRKLQLLKRESPEFLPLVEDVKSKCEELQCILNPLMKLVKEGRVKEGPIRQYITTKYRLVLNYVSTVSMYVLVKCSEKSARNHPVVARLAQYRQLLQELEVCDNKLASHLGKLLSRAPVDDDDSAAGDDSAAESLNSPVEEEKTGSKKRKKELKILKKNKSAKMDMEDKEKWRSLLKDPLPEIRNSKTHNVMDASSDEELGDPDNTEEVVGDKQGLDADTKRPIGYKITKNKGLMPYRNKDQRNPRVRYRNKYKKKLKRRVGQVRKVKKELNRYGGEVTGIRSHSIKSIKIKA